MWMLISCRWSSGLQDCWGSEVLQEVKWEADYRFAEGDVPASSRERAWYNAGWLMWKLWIYVTSVHFLLGNLLYDFHFSLLNVFVGFEMLRSPKYARLRLSIWCAVNFLCIACFLNVLMLRPFRLLNTMLTIMTLMQRSLESKSVRGWLRLKLASFLHHGYSVFPLLLLFQYFP